MKRIISYFHFRVIPSRKRFLVVESSSGTDDDDDQHIACYPPVRQSSKIQAEKSGRDAANHLTAEFQDGS